GRGRLGRPHRLRGRGARRRSGGELAAPLPRALPRPGPRAPGRPARAALAGLGPTLAAPGRRRARRHRGPHPPDPGPVRGPARPAAGHGRRVVGLVVVLLAGLATVLTMTTAVRRLRAAAPRTRVPAAVQAAVTELAPDVVLYHAGDAHSAYQVDVWTPVLERL